jgi:hypothetical protein
MLKFNTNINKEIKVHLDLMITIIIPNLHVRKNGKKIKKKKKKILKRTMSQLMSIRKKIPVYRVKENKKIRKLEHQLI